jgi:coenzyme F420-reducing hydrogenase alpha subunit
MSACAAIEDACGVVVDGPLRDLRRLLYAGEWIESHALHIHLLHAPDFLGYPSAVDLAADHRDLVQRGLDIKKVGNEVLELVGGRAIHPVNVKVGGFYRVPTRSELAPLRERLARSLDAAVDVVRWVAGFDFPDHHHPLELVALRDPSGYAVLGGRLVSDRGLDITADQFAEHVVETHVARSTALHAHLIERGEYLVGPMARFALNSQQLAEPAAAVAAEVGLRPDERNPFRSIVVRAVEVVHACAEAVAIIDDYQAPERPAEPVEPRAAAGYGWTEAPRGLLWHRYELDVDGTITDARIVPPTSQNQPAIEHDLFHLVEDQIDLADDDLRHLCEQAIRNFDPCISCATHFLDLTVERS